MRKAAAVLALVASIALGDVVLKNQDALIGPVQYINCGAGVVCWRDGGVGNIRETSVFSDGGTTYTFDAPLYNDGGTVGCLAAGATDAGCVTAATQTFGGDKTFNGKVGIGISPDTVASLHVGGRILIEDPAFTAWQFYLTTGAADNKRWQEYSWASGFNFTAVNDLNTLEHVWMGVSRTGWDVTSISYGNALNEASNDSLFFDITNKRLGIGKRAPAVALDVVGAVTATGALGGSNFSGTSSGANTGDQTRTCGLGSYITTLDLGSTSACGTPAAPTYPGTADSTTYLRGDGTWASVSAITPLPLTYEFGSMPRMPTPPIIIVARPAWTLPPCNPLRRTNCRP